MGDFRGCHRAIDETMKTFKQDMIGRPVQVATALSLTVLAITLGPPDAAARNGSRFPAIAGAAAVRAAVGGVMGPSRGHGATLAGIVSSVQAWSRPGGGRKVWWVQTQTVWTAEPQVLLVLGSASRAGRQWLRVLLPIRPNGTTGWIARDNAVLLSTPYWITVDKRARQVLIYRSGKRVSTYPAVIGKPATPTPDGLAAIYERDPQPARGGFLGIWALPLTIFSNALYNFGGGPGRVAIHGRGGASLSDPLGSARSHGCIRVDNSSVAWMARNIPQGTPVQITG